MGKLDKIIFWTSLVMIFLPMPFVWCAYGEKGVTGMAMLSNPFLWGVLVVMVLSVFVKNKWIDGLQKAARILLLFDYVWFARDFANHLPGYVFSLSTVCIPWWISFIGAIGLVFSAYAANQKEETNS